MRFQIHHRTTYRYHAAATESFMEARLQPANTPTQRLGTHRVEIDPKCNVHAYTDYCGNVVQTFSIVRRHESLTLDSYAEVETSLLATPDAVLELSVSEARQIYRSKPLAHFEFLNPSPAISFTAEVHKLANQFFRPGNEIGPSVLELNHWVNQTFRYQPGSTHISTTVPEVLTQRTGVCQDFAQVMIAILRSAEIPSRYVVGYIETDTQRDANTDRKRRPRALIGAAESHAWVGICLPSGKWWPLDPPNDCIAGLRHVKVASGRDYLDCTPTRGVFKGTHTDRLEVSVTMRA
ncbi:MAG: transglutaminase family protein [Candidatus Synoicihabitans palmerolidicus]|nr:transglutaminase family protein [Candidatus Synoicihabitans palmerolidicus]